MSFKKLNSLLKESLATLKIEEPLPFQKKVMPIIKGGADAYVVGKEGSGKTTALIIYTIHKLKAEAFEDSPRALILVENQEKVNQLKDEFNRYSKNTDLRIYATSERYDFEKQKVEIYYGQDVVIGTPSFITKLYFQNALHIGQVQVFALDDAGYLGRNNAYNHILRLTESMDKFQSIIIANEWNSKIANYQNGYMSNARVLKK
ncbi:MAG: DEAD/DEAH box helicase [Winogradskyella sp.]|uniref:DEAD/DEAH box helicase n=1 Tax=Winogradskyella sp. TaxID=1883156 RepID=UPI0017C8542C|nr:DEAD/DEAH box helicase [Winogradskyella sp.]MBT8245359.1 DEAD/DEAH box helicase [Winogradskyella sp.]NNK23638.1 DEAD/DEAH box helicase [Winogradskyella sp.]